MRWTIHARLLVGSLIAIPSARPDDAAPAWELRLEDGATAVLARDNDGTRVARTNALGRVHLVWSSPIATETDGTVQLNLPYRADDASVANLLLLRATARPDDTPRLEGDSQAFAVWTGQSLVRNMPAGRWDTRLATARAKAGGSLTIHAILAGNPGTTWLGTPTVEPLPIVRPLYEPYDDPFTEEQVREALEKRPVGTAHAADHNGRKALFVEGRPVPAVIHKALGANDSRGDFAGFAGAGIHLTTAAISTGDTGAGRSDRDEPIWLGRDRFALDRIDAALLRVLRRDPEARIILDVRVEPYKDWGREHPDEIVRDAEGRRAYGPCSYVGQYTDDAGLIDAPGSGKWWYPSWQSEVWRGDLEHVFEKVAAHVKTSPYGKAVVGFFVTGRDDGQFVVHYNDHSNPTERSFRSYLESRYKTIDRLNAAWKTAHPSFESITVPAQSWDSGRTHYEPGPEPEFRAFRARDPWAVRDRLAAALKRGIGRPAVVLAYAAPYHPAFADCAYLDGVGMQPDYAHRRPSFSVAYNPVSADDVGDRLLFTELDLRTPRGEGWPTTPPYLAWVSAASSIDEFTQVHRKITGISLANGYGDWYYDMGQYFRDPALHDEIATVKDVRAKLLDTPRGPFRPDVCVVIAEDDRPYLTTDEAVIPHDEVNFHPQWQALAASGVPYERHYLPDILSRPELQRFKVYVFLENAYISIKDRAAIRSKLLNAGRTAIWVYNSGLVSEDGRSDAAMSDLIGIRIVAGTKAAHRTTILDIPGLRPHAAASEFLALIFNNGAPGVEPFHVIDDTATLLGHHAETGEVAVASKRQDGWNSVYIGSAQGLTDDLLNYLARQAGAYVAGPPGQMLHLSGEFASIHTLRSGDYTLTPPPGRARIVDAFTGEVLASGPNPYTFPVEVGRTYWFLFE